MATVRIEKISEVHLKVWGSMDVEQEIKDFYTFKAPRHQFHPKFKARLWDGTMSLYNLATKRLPAGLIHSLLEFLTNEGVEVEFVENKDFGHPCGYDEEITIEDVKEFCDSLQPWSDKQQSVIEIHDYQYEAIFQALKSRRLALISPTASGKSLILYCIIRYLIDKIDDTARICLVVPNVGLVNQMFSDFDEYSKVNGWKVEDISQKLFSGKPRELTQQILITTWQSLKSVIPKQGGSKVLNTYDAVLVDEAHAAKGKELQNILNAMTLVPYRIGTTGTTTDPVNQLIIEGCLGRRHKVITTKELMDRGAVSSMKIRAVVLRYSDTERKFVSQKTKEKDPLDYPQEMDFLQEHVRRTKVITNLALACQGTTLVLFTKKDHGKAIYQSIRAKTDRKVFYIDGDMDGELREKLRNEINAGVHGSDPILVASFGTFSTGINIPSIRNVIFGAPTKASIRILQSIGRGLRLHKDKDKLNLFDIVDDLKWKKTKNFALDHFEERLKIYQMEKFEIYIKELQL